MHVTRTLNRTLPGLALTAALSMPGIAVAVEPVVNFSSLGITPSPGTQQEPGRVYSNTPQQFSYDAPSDGIFAQVYGAPLDLDSRLQVSATSTVTTANPSAAGFAATRRWQVLSGPGTQATLFADISFAGSFMASGSGGASFTNILSYRASPDASAAIVLLSNGTANPLVTESTPCSFPSTGTVADICFGADGDTHSINEVMRSLAFTVDLGVPFALTLTLNATAATNGAGSSASVDFYDPMLAGLFIDLGNESIVPLSGAPGYSLRVTGIPAPATLMLLGIGLAGLAAAARRRQ